MLHKVCLCLCLCELRIGGEENERDGDELRAMPCTHACVRRFVWTNGFKPIENVLFARIQLHRSFVKCASCVYSISYLITQCICAFEFPRVCAQWYGIKFSGIIHVCVPLGTRFQGLSSTGPYRYRCTVWGQTISEGRVSVSILSNQNCYMHSTLKSEIGAGSQTSTGICMQYITQLCDYNVGLSIAKDIAAVQYEYSTMLHTTVRDTRKSGSQTGHRKRKSHAHVHMKHM